VRKMDENKKETFLQRLRRRREEKEIKTTKKIEVVKPIEPGKKPEGLTDQVASMSEKLDRLTGEDKIKKRLKKKQFKLKWPRWLHNPTWIDVIYEIIYYILYFGYIIFIIFLKLETKQKLSDLLYV
ncbi:hypothetical protein LCGC14_1422430, partial [marine sediment metagenome]